jgi:hypothetical protein
VADEELLGEVVDGEPLALRARAQREQRLVVLRGEAALLGLDLGKTREDAQCTTERRKLQVLVFAQLGPASRRGYR